MNYPGNETLAEEIRERILSTFRQTLELAEKGDQSEAQLGCDFVLRLDPLFEPARKLHRRLRAATSELIDVADLRATVDETVSTPSDTLSKGTAAPALEDRDPIEPPATDSGPADAPFLVDLEIDSSELDLALDLSSLQEESTLQAPTEPPPQTDSPAEEVAQPTDESGADARTEPIASLDDESQQRVQDLLSEGQAAFDKSEYQTAVDSWSRIFLIDIDHAEASRRIDLARKLKAEVERKLEETFHEALAKVEAGNLDEARKGFLAVLQTMPGHVAAQEYLDRLDRPDSGTPEPAPAAEPRAVEEGLLDDILPSEGGFSDDLASVPEKHDQLHSPMSAEARPKPSIGGVGRASRQKKSPNQTFRTVAVAMLIVLGVVGWFLYRNWDDFFPNASDTAAPVRLDPITRARQTYAEAGAAISIAQLRRLSPGHAQYDEAQALIAKWEASLDASKPKDDAPDPEFLAARDQLVDEARAAFEEERFLLVQELLERGAAQAALEGSAKEMLEQARDNLDPLHAEIAMFREGEWEMSLHNLWRTWESGVTTPDVRRLMVDSYFNLGVRDLQRRNVAAALSNLQEAKELSADDPQLSRLIEFAETYQSRPDDLLYRIFVKYLPFR